MEAIRCQQLSRRYGQVEALKSLDLTVQRGTVFGFLGRNGAGKTTTIRLLTGLARPTAGAAWVMGVKSSTGDAAAHHQFGYLPEEPAFYTWMNPKEYLGHIGRLYALAGRELEKRIGELLALAGLSDVADRRLAGFSRGMRQRLGIAQALIHRPPVLFLDEPTSALDPAGRRVVLELIEQLRGQTTVFLSSHILGDVERVCETIGVIHQGELLLTATREELVASYDTDVVELEVEQPLADVALLTKRLHSESWVSALVREDNTVRVSVNDVAAAKGMLLPMVVELGLVLTRYEWVRPSLEEVFLEISGRH